jgi:hypothetical protein
MPIPEFKCQSPVSIDPNGPPTLLFAFERMKSKASDVHIIDDLSYVERHQLHPEPLRMMRLDAGLVPRLIVPASR